MLDSKVDKQIKRYLKNISDKKICQSKVNGSCHYFMTTESGTFEVRFADHFSPTGDRADFDIVKVRDLYIIKFEEIQYSLYEEDALTYIKALFLVGPEMSEQLAISRKQANEYKNKWTFYKHKWNKHQEDVKFMDEIWAEKERIESENKQLMGFKETYQELLNKYNKVQNDLKTSKNNFNTIQSNYNILKKSFNSLNKQLNNLKQIFNRINDTNIT